MNKSSQNTSFRLFFALLVFLLAGNGVLLHAGNPQQDYLDSTVEIHSFNEDSLNFYKNELQYPDLKDEKEDEEDEEETSNVSLDELWVNLLKFAFFLTIALLIAFIIYKVSDSYRPRTKSKKIVRQNREIELEEIRENLHETNLVQLINQAITAKDFRHAVSLYYLEALKQLSNKNLVSWRKAKTNAEYLQELKGQAFEPEFRGLTHVFEVVFYGKNDLTEAKFLEIQPDFEQMLSIIDQTKPADE